MKEKTAKTQKKQKRIKEQGEGTLKGNDTSRVNSRRKISGKICIFDGPRGRRRGRPKGVPLISVGMERPPDVLWFLWVEV